jgi:hypothetical protein
VLRCARIVLVLLLELVLDHGGCARLVRFERGEVTWKNRGRGRFCCCTVHWRDTEWRNWKTGAVESRELYDHTSDQPELENVIGNLAAQAALEEAEKLLRAQFPLTK